MFNTLFHRILYILLAFIFFTAEATEFIKAKIYFYENEQVRHLENERETRGCSVTVSLQT